MQPSQLIIDFVKGFEQLRLSAMKPMTFDRWTIGYGMTYYPNFQPVKQGDTITKVQAEEDFAKLFQIFANKVNELIEVNLTQNQIDSLYSLAYNIGIPQFKTSTILKIVNDNPCYPNITHWFEVWNKEDGKIVNGLTVRREREALIYTQGIYNSEH